MKLSELTGWLVAAPALHLYGGAKRLGGWARAIPAGESRGLVEHHVTPSPIIVITSEVLMHDEGANDNNASHEYE
jgi:hypothetical protein